MEQFVSTAWVCAGLVLQALTTLIIALFGYLVWKVHQRQKENGEKIEETRENVSRLINGKGVAHDHARALEALHGTAHEANAPPAQGATNEFPLSTRQENPAP